MALSFKDVNGNNIPFDNKNKLSLDKQKDVVTGEITAYLVEYNDNTYDCRYLSYHNPCKKIKAEYIGKAEVDDM